MPAIHALLVVLMAAALTSAQMPGQCQNTCVSQHARNGMLYKKMFQGSISQTDYTSICNDVTAVNSCLQSCGNSSSDCLTASMPLYTQACSTGYQQFSQLGQCYNNLNAGYSAAQQQCQQQCATQTAAAGRRRRRQAAVQNALVNGDTFCITNCGLSQELATIQAQCSPWVAQFAQAVSQTYNQLYQLSPTCLAL